MEVDNGRLLNNLRHNLGPVITAALDDPDVLEIMANPDGSLWIERFGELRAEGAVSAMTARIVVSLVADSLNMTATAEHPIIEGTLPGDGSRFEGLMPPVVAQPTFSIRKKPTRIYTLEDYAAAGIMPESVHAALVEALRTRKNILVVGGTGSGKTTLVNGIIRAMAEICAGDRLIIIEDTPELQSSNPNTVELRSTQYATPRDLARATLRLRPDRILMGEMRDGGTALEVLKAWNTGHPGGISTLHANSALEGLSRMEDLIGEVSASPMQRLIGQAVDLAVFIRRAPEVGRRVTQAVRVSHFDAVTQTYSAEFIHDEETSSLSLAA